MSTVKLINEILPRTVLSLGAFLNSEVPRNLEVGRIARVLYVLAYSGCSVRVPIFDHALDYVVARQQLDGGWSDPEETAWAAGSIRLMRSSSDPALASAIHWLNSVRHPSGGWGRHPRDQARIPITALISVLTPEVVKHEDINWVINEWQRDFDGQVRLSYKAGFFLLAIPERQENDLVLQTISHLSEDQNEDGGFGPWKDHTVGSDPWSTGIVLLGLLSYPDLVKRQVIERAVNWLSENQLSNGLWAYHYIDEGSAYAYWGLVEALKYLSKELS